MTDTFTRIRVPGSTRPGLMDEGEQPPETMIKMIRQYSAHLRAEADEIDAAPDAAFRIDVVRGCTLCRHVKTLQEGAA